MINPRDSKLLNKAVAATNSRVVPLEGVGYVIAVPLTANRGRPF